MAYYCSVNTSTFTSLGFLSHPSWTGAGNANWSIEWDFVFTALADNQFISGNTSGSTVRGIRLFLDGRISVNGVAAISVAPSGTVSAGVRYKAKLESVGTTKSLYLKLASDASYGSPVCTGTDNNSYLFNAVTRASTAYSRRFDVYGLATLGGTYSETWDGTNAPSTGTTWTGASSNVITLTNTQGTADAQWVFYDSITTTGIPNNTLGAALNQPCAINLDNYFTGATSYSVMSGSLPTGLSIVGNQIVGTPTTAQSTTLVIRASNSIDLLDSATITFNTGLWYLAFDGAGGIAAPTLGNVITGTPKIKIVIKKFRFAAGNAAVFWQGGTSFSLRELVFRRNGTGWDVFCGNTATVIGTTAAVAAAFGNAELACDEFGFEIDGTTCRLYKDGMVVFTKTIGRSAGRLNNSLFYIGCQPADDTAGNTTLSTPAPNGSEYGDISVYVNDVLVREYNTSASGGVGNLLIDRVSNQNGTQVGTWPADDGEWVFYDAGGGSVGAEIAGGLPVPTAAAAVTDSTPLYSATISAGLPVPVATLQATDSAPGNSVSIIGGLPVPVAAVVVSDTTPVFGSVIVAGLPIPVASVVAQDFSPLVTTTVNAGLPIPTAAAQMLNLGVGVGVIISAGLPVPTAQAVLTDSTPQFSVTIQAGLPVPVAYAQVSDSWVATASIIAGLPVPTASVQFADTTPQLTAVISAGLPVPVAVVVTGVIIEGQVISFSEGCTLEIPEELRFAELPYEERFVSL